MKTILMVDDEPNNLRLLEQILKDEYRLLFANSGERGIAVAREYMPDLIILDIMMPNISGYEVCRILKQDEATNNIPIIFISAIGDAENEVHGFDLGAVDFIHRPFSPQIVSKRVNTHMSLVRAIEVEKSQRAAIYMLGDAGHYNDNGTGIHLWRMAAFAQILALELGWSEEQAGLLELAAAMHDTGKLGMPDSILKAPRRLTKDEWAVMETHPLIGYNILKKSDTPLFRMAATIALYHHERWDGSGYPSRLAGGNIPEVARIVAVVNTFDALLSERPYRHALDLDISLQTIRRASGKHFDPRIIEAFERALPRLLRCNEVWREAEKQLISDPTHKTELNLSLLREQVSAML